MTQGALRPGGRLGSSAYGRTVVGATVAILVLGSVGALVLTHGRRHRAAPQPALVVHQKRPNVILIVTDDQRWDSLFAMPYLRRLLAADGVRFTNAFVTTSYCCPSRASILTGDYSHTTGVYSDTGKHGGAKAFKDRSTVATWLQQGGYDTALVGKYLNLYDRLAPYTPPGWSDWNALASPIPATKYYDYSIDENGRMVHYGTRPRDYVDSVLEGKAVSFLRSARSPYFLYYAPIAPHGPAVPAPGDLGRFRYQPLPHRPDFNEADVSDKPWDGLGIFHPLTTFDIATLTKLWDDQLASLQQVDRSIRTFVSLLRGDGQLQDTVFMFMSDNGLLLGEHRIRGLKIWPYEESIRIPLVIAGPGISDPGRSDGHLVCNIDIAPTIAQLAHVRPGLHEDGRSLIPLLLGRPGPWRHAFLVEYLGAGGLSSVFVAPFEGIRTGRYLFVQYGTLRLERKGPEVHYPNGSTELYDLGRDPYEMTNLAKVPAEQPVERRLAARLARMLQR